MVASSISPQMAQVRRGVSGTAAKVASVAKLAPASAIPGPPVPGDHPVKKSRDITGEEAEEGLAFRGAGLAGFADVSGGAAFLGNPATGARLEGVAERDGLD